ncbi:MAG: tetratricopeptide repeat protein [Candidatus Omnitrophica bacterium]|nr:tetratricopeptide repeat protein [Candidatus Omnitrophota bacterium]MDD5430145.1 tetratricopeptide repeat protein [Candidatus Omnitrophota bacterium]
MRRIVYIVIIGIIVLLISPQAAHSESVTGYIKKGNRLYKAQRYKDALGQYKQAQGISPANEIANFNAGTAYYKQGLWEEAAASFMQALACEDKNIEASANYNIGNSRYKQGEAEEAKTVQKALSFYRQARDYYKRAIELNQDDLDSKFNYELVVKKIELLEQQQQDQQQQQQQQDQHNQAQDQNDQQQQDENNQGQDDKDQQNQDQNQDQNQNEDEDKDNNQDQDDEDQQQPPASDPDDGEMSQDEAKSFLERYGQEEENAKEKRGSRQVYPEVLKDW